MKNLFSFLFLVLSSISMAKTKELTITVIDGINQEVLPNITIYKTNKKDKTLLGKTNSEGILIIAVKSSNILITVFDQKGIYESSDTYYKFTDKATSDTLKIECFPKNKKNNMLTEKQYAALNKQYDQLGIPVEDSVDQEAEFYGGLPKLMKTINSNLTLPDEVFEKEINVKIIVQYLIEADGTVTHVEILQGSIPELNAAVINMVYNLPAFKPAKKNGKAVRSVQQFPIKIVTQ